LAGTLLSGSNIMPSSVDEMAAACAWLEACGYPGLKMLDEALTETPRENQRPVLELDAIGVDLRNISCVFSAPHLAALAVERKRLFLRNVRHGLYLLPFAVNANIGIGCPVDPAFALGGERTKNPYGEKLAIAEQNGINVDDELWARLAARAKDLSLP
jgi:hypothetical protein